MTREGVATAHAEIKRERFNGGQRLAMQMQALDQLFLERFRVSGQHVLAAEADREALEFHRRRQISQHPA